MSTNKEIARAVKIISEGASIAAKKKDYNGVQNTENQLIIEIVEQFLRDKQRIIYGGAAINALLPPEDKFYDATASLPDYDLLSSDPIGDCQVLVSAFEDAGFTEVESKLGIHEGTYKVFVSYKAAADITFIPDFIFDRIAAKGKVRDGMLFAGPDYLRMAAYLELSRPMGDTSRWEKVYHRLQLLNRAYPLTRCLPESVEKATEDQELVSKTLLQYIIEKEHVMISANVVNVLSRRVKNPDLSTIDFLVKSEPKYVVLVADAEKTANEIVVILAAALPALNISVDTRPAVGELLPERIEIRINRQRVLSILPTIACHSYIEIQTEAGILRVGSIDTLMTFFLTFFITGFHKIFGVRILCLCEVLMRHERRVLRSSDPLKRISVLCLGHQHSLSELKRAHRMRILDKKEHLKQFVINALKLKDE